MSRESLSACGWSQVFSLFLFNYGIAYNAHVNVHINNINEIDFIRIQNDEWARVISFSGLYCKLLFWTLTSLCQRLRKGGLLNYHVKNKWMSLNRLKDSLNWLAFRMLIMLCFGFVCWTWLHKKFWSWKIDWFELNFFYF